MQYGGHLEGGSAYKRKLKIGATVVAEQVTILDGSGPGQSTDPTVTAAADAHGVCLEAGTYSTTQGTGASSANIEVDTVIATPGTLFRSPISGGSGDNENVALSITENDLANAGGIKIEDADLPSDSMVAGWVYGLTAANRSQTRVLISMTSAASINVTVPFDNTIASGNQFLVFGACPWVGTKINLTTNFSQVSQWFPSATGVNAAIVDILVDDADPAAPTATMIFAFRDSYLNSESA